MADLGIPVVLPDSLQVLSPWFGAVPTSGTHRRNRDWDSSGGGREASRRRGETRRVTGGSSFVGSARSPGSGPSQYWAASSLPMAEGPPPAPGIASPGSVGPVAGQRQWYEGADAVITRDLREELSVSWGDVSPGATLIGTARTLSGVLDNLQWAPDAVASGRGTLLELCSEVTQIVNRQEVADRWGRKVYAEMRERLPSGDQSPPWGGV